MARPSRSHRKSALAGMLVLLLGGGLTSAFATSAAPASASRAAHKAHTRLHGFSTTPATPLVDGTVTDKVSIRPRAQRHVYVQARRPGSTAFHTIKSASGHSHRNGDFTAVYHPTTEGTWKFRLLLPSTHTATRLLSPARTITATRPAPGPPAPGPAPGPAPAPAPAPSVSVTTAALSLNGSTGTTAKQTVNVNGAFDLTGTHAGRGETLTSAKLDYGDGTVEAFEGDPATWFPAHQYTNGRAVTATLTVVDSAGGTDQTSIDITMFVHEPTATISVAPDSERKPGKPVTFEVSSFVPGDSSFTHFDTYSLASGATVFDNQRSGPGAPPAEFSITFAKPGSYTVLVDGDNDAGGLAEAKVRVVIDDNPST